jgi:hypothetical protein
VGYPDFAGSGITQHNLGMLGQAGGDMIKKKIQHVSNPALR